MGLYKCCAVAFIGATVIAVSPPVAAQTSVVPINRRGAPIAQPETAKEQPPATDALLLEVQGLRRDMQLFSATSIRVQMLVARLQLQEQRISTLYAQASDARRLVDQNASAKSELAEKLGRTKTAASNTNTTPEDRGHFKSLVTELEREMKVLEGEGEKLALRDADLSNQMAAEQGRWVEFNNRLEELERALPATRR